MWRDAAPSETKVRRVTEAQLQSQRLLSPAHPRGRHGARCCASGVCGPSGRASRASPEDCSRSGVLAGCAVRRKQRQPVRLRGRGVNTQRVRRRGQVLRCSATPLRSNARAWRTRALPPVFARTPTGALHVDECASRENFRPRTRPRRCSPTVDGYDWHAARLEPAPISSSKRHRYEQSHCAQRRVVELAAVFETGARTRRHDCEHAGSPHLVNTCGFPRPRPYCRASVATRTRYDRALSAWSLRSARDYGGRRGWLRDHIDDPRSPRCSSFRLLARSTSCAPRDRAGAMNPMGGRLATPAVARVD